MDCSAEYIKMCEKAEEIQSALSNNDGYGGEIKQNDNNEPYPIAWIYDDEPQCLKCEREVKSNFCPKCGSKTQIRVTGSICKDGPCSNDLESDRIVWLPRQDQLQWMLKNTHTFGWALDCFILWVYEVDEENRMIGLNNNLLKQFTSMEQLWLTFIMKEKYNKVWDGKDWVANERNQTT